MKLIFRFIIFTIFLLTFTVSSAQDSTITRYVLCANIKDTLITSTIELDNFQSYRYNHSPFDASSGNIGLQQIRLNTLQLPSYNGFFQGFSSSLLSIDDLKFYNQEKDITTLRYINGANSEQYFNVFHSNQFGKGLNLSFDYNRIISEGFYIYQLTDNTHFNSTLNYTSRSNKYNLKLGYLISNIKIQENGGVSFSDTSGQDIDNSNLIPFKLSSAFHKLRSQALVIDQSLLLSDSSSLKKIKLYHQSDLSWSWKWYKDQGDQEFYDKFYMDSLSTYDSIHYSKASNRIGVSVLDDLLRLDYLYEFHDYYQDSNFDTLYTSQFIKASVYKNFGKLESELSFLRGIVGFNRGDYSQNLKLRYGLDSNNFISFLSSNTRTTPYYWQNKFYGNHVFYNNDFDPQEQVKVETKWINSEYNFSLGLEYDRNSHLIIYNTNSEPFQSAETIDRFLLNLEKNFILGSFRFNNNINYQFISNDILLPLPSIFTAHSFFYERSFFGKKLFTQLGSDIRYIGAYKGYGFFPESAAFTLQNERELGDFVYLDLFLNFRIQHAKVFAKVENLLGDQFEPDGMMINNYGIPGRVFKIGLSWAMFN